MFSFGNVAWFSLQLFDTTAAEMTGVGSHSVAMTAQKRSDQAVGESKGIKLKGQGVLLLQIANQFDDIEKVKGLCVVLLNDDGKFVNTKTVEGAIPAVKTLAHKVLCEWLTKMPLQAHGGNLLAALRHDVVNAADIAEEFASQLVPGIVQSKIACDLYNQGHTKYKQCHVVYVKHTHTHGNPKTPRK